MRVASLSSPLKDIPVDFLADPDGQWDYDQLVEVAGFDPGWGQVSIGALTDSFGGFPDGAAVVLLTTADHYSVALVDCLCGALAVSPAAQQHAMTDAPASAAA